MASLLPQYLIKHDRKWRTILRYPPLRHVPLFTLENVRKPGGFGLHGRTASGGRRRRVFRLALQVCGRSDGAEVLGEKAGIFSARFGSLVRETRLRNVD